MGCVSIQMAREIRLDDSQATDLYRHGANAETDEENEMAHFWEPLSDAVAVELFGSRWPLEGDPVHIRPLELLISQRCRTVKWHVALGAWLALHDRCDNDADRITCLVNAAAHASRWEQPLVALAAGRAAFELSGPDPEVLMPMAFAAGDLGRSDEALELYATCRRQFVDGGRPVDVAWVDMNIALVHKGLGHNELAVDMLTAAAECFEDACETGMLGACRLNLVNALLACRRLDEALEMADVVVERERESGSALMIAHAVYNRARVLRSKGDLEGAREGWIEALESYRKLDLPPKQADCLDVLGSMACEEGLFDFAVQMRLEALRLYAGGNHPIDEAMARYSLAVTYVRMGRYVEAIEMCDLATGVGGTDLDPGLAKAAALEGLGDGAEAERLRAAWLDRHGQESYDETIASLR